MSRVTIVFFALVLVLLFSNFSSEARHVPDAVTSTITTTASNKDIAEESCAGVGKEECLMRRTLVAHLDYIYTQEKNP